MPSLPYDYDANGNMTAKQTTQTVSGTSSQSNMDLSGHGSDSGLEIYRYDAFNRLSSHNNGAMAASYAYNANNLRASKTVNNTKTDFVWNGQNLAAESTGSGVNTYTYDITGIHITSRNGTVMSYIKDSHGSVIRTADASGNAMQEAEYRADYDAFGNSYQGSRNTPFGYCGEYVDSESGNVYLRNRYYDPALGRFITEDPAQDGLNWYVYAGNNPVIMIDPWGLAPFDHFSSADDAAADFGLYIGQKSIDIEEEFFSFIFMDVDEDGNEYFYYDEPRNDYETHEERSTGFYFKEFNADADAIAHTHGAYDADTENTKDGFSSPGNSLDPNFTDTSESDRLGVNYYVVTPVGNLYRYDANSDNYSGTLIRSDMPVDSSIAIHQNMKNTLLWKLLCVNFPKATAQDFVNARRNNPDSLLDTLDELERFR